MERFAFIIHPMDLKRDAARKYPVLKYMPLKGVQMLARRLGPSYMSHITGVRSATGAECEGWLLGCSLDPEMLLSMPEEFVYDKIAACGRYAAELGAKIVGLGAFTSVVGDAGLSVAKRLEGVINVTSGNSYTTYTAIEGLMRGAELMEIDAANARCAVVGATGSIGALCAQMMARRTGALTLIGRDEAKMEPLRAQILREHPGTDVKISTDVRALRECDLVLAVSSATDALIFPEHLRSGAVVCDVARPRDVSKSVVDQRDDVLVIEGGIIDVPGPADFAFDFGFPSGTAYACMSETILMALEGTYEPYTLGRDLTVEQVERIGQIAHKHGFKISGFRAFERAVTDETIAQVRANARGRRVTSLPNPKEAAKDPAVVSVPA